MSITIALLLIASAPVATDTDSEVRARALAKIELCQERLGNQNGVLVEHGVLCFSGGLEDARAEEYREATQGQSFTHAVMRSNGGSVASALDIAEDLLARQITAIGWEYCLSSCANYLFMAGDNKILMSGHLLAWHGGPGGPDSISPDNEYRDDLIAIWERSNAFYDAIGVDPALMGAVPEGQPFDYDNPGMSFWMAPREHLESFGVTGILIYDDLDTWESDEQRVSIPIH